MAKKQTLTKEFDPRALKVAQKLKKIRIEKGYTSYENFAIDKGIKRMQYWRMETGANFTFKSLLKILDAHEMSLAEFFEDFSYDEE
ncbi:helix-turn-helix domain-containing protein [Polaribacter sp. MSW13]|uniref:Helix-turn-helix domain-containing protein n=1 Tax=Polaribacter marinus TaxID=2916838 RepID=A0A9X1VVC6_9FLAO|nr:helix-turn-helix transcriptional regulator [Polaribacter marinus]MCI2230311.1 helix-turn-helix domain-containing protein [Polaribacter marinus]